MPDVNLAMALSFWTATLNGGYGGVISKSHAPLYANFWDVRRVLVAA
jgi:hypothetical protein